MSVAKNGGALEIHGSDSASFFVKKTTSKIEDFTASAFIEDLNEASREKKTRVRL